MSNKILNILSHEFPTEQAVTTEIINLNAILNLPKGTEHFMSDLHGEHLAFLHIMNNCSGVIREKIDLAFEDSLTPKQKAEIASLIYYPEKVLPRVRRSPNRNEKYRMFLLRLIRVSSAVTSKYSRSKVRKALPKDFAYIIDEMLHSEYTSADMEGYYANIIDSMIKLGSAEAFITALCNLIKRMAIDGLHIVGDIFDRGPHADVIISRLRRQHSVDLQWGNHDVLWMGAAAGSPVCVATVVKNCIQYDNLDMLETSYGISLLPLAIFATEYYGESTVFEPRVKPVHGYKPKDQSLYAKMHKAMCVIMFKLEGQLLERNPQFDMDCRNMLRRINYDDMTIEINGVRHELRDKEFPTIDKNDPNRLSEAEQRLIDGLTDEFMYSTRLQEHIDYLYDIGSVYKVCNNNLLYHGCVPTNVDGSFTEFEFFGTKYSGKKLFDYVDKVARDAFYAPLNSDARAFGRDFMWFLWCGKYSPIFGKECITTFERALLLDESTWKEPKNVYYSYCNDEEFCLRVLREFGITAEYSHIVNGHIPVKVKAGEAPCKANGRLLLIDGGFCKPYQKTTGIAGFTMFFSSHGLRIYEHEPFKPGSDDDTLLRTDINSRLVMSEKIPKRLLVADTDIGKDLRNQIEVLTELLKAYRAGTIKEKR